MNETQFGMLEKRISSYKEDVIQIQQELTAIPALSPENGGDGETRKAESIKKILDRLEFEKMIQIDAPDIRVTEGKRPNLIAQMKGKSNQKTIWIMSHMDVVPPGNTSLWMTEPYSAVEKDGKIFGRGTEDNQQAIAASILAIKALREEHIIPEYEIGLAIVSDEETGSEFGIKYILKTHPNLFRAKDLIIIPDAGDSQGELVEVAEKSILWIRFEIKGKQTHGSTPQKGANAHKAGAHLIVKMNQLYQEYGLNDPLFDPPISTFEPTKKENNVLNVNTIPAEDVFYFDCRILPNYGLEKIKDRISQWALEIEGQFGVKIQLSYPHTVEAPSPTPVDSPVVLTLKKAVKAVLGRSAKTIGIGGGTVAAHFREHGLPAVCWTNIADVAHEPNEYSIIDNTLKDAKVFAHIFLQP